MKSNIASKYAPTKIENKWYNFWIEHRLFSSTPDERPAYSIVIPPPNVTGVLHMGHMLNNTIQDILIRRARMLGFNTLWVPGTDHASIATEAKVVALLKEKGIDKKDISREEFLKYAWEWKEKHGGIILQQLKKLGASCDWERTKFTMDTDLSESVIDAFIDLYNKGKIYRGVRMVNWDPKALTALSDEEVIYQEVESNLYYIKYQIQDEENDFLTIATTRPETIFGDTAVCVHPDDKRYQHLKGKKAIIPLINRIVPIIFDEYVDQEFGTGALKVTPAHDINDYQLGLKYKLEFVNIFNDNGTLNEDARFFVGVDRFQARKQVIPLLEKEGNLIKIENYSNKVGFSERTNEVIEPKLSLQWFCEMSSLAKPALEVVMDDTIKFYPEKFKNSYAHWMENVKDWCISRQLWWGHRIPAYYLPNKEFVIAKNRDIAFQIAKEKFPDLTFTIDDLKQDEDVLDTWFSSWLWPISVFDGMRYPENQDINYYYPTSTLITAPDIIFFWVARMIMAGLEWRGEIPFKSVYFTGTVRDHLRRKMSKSLGNSPEPLHLIDKFGADGVRFGMLHSSPAGNDLLFDESLCEQGRNFNNKIWNAFRLIQGWEKDQNAEQPLHTATAIRWFETRLNDVLAEIKDDFEKYRLSNALMTTYKLIWDDFCSWFLEIVKPPYQKPIDNKSYEKIVNIFEQLMQILHPFMPFITEELWQKLRERDEKESIMYSIFPQFDNSKQNNSLIDNFEIVKRVIENIRRIRTEHNIPNRDLLDLVVNNSAPTTPSQTDTIIMKLANLSSIHYKTTKNESSLSFIVQNVEYFIPYQVEINIKDERKKIEEELRYTEGFLQGVLKKLANEKFINGAPETVVATERKKQQDAEEKINLLKTKLHQLDQ